jgi:Bacterial Ig-like domain
VPNTSIFSVRWFNPRSGGALQTGTVASITGGALRSLGNAPSDLAQDWAVLVQHTNGAPVNAAPTVSAGPDRNITLPNTATLTGTATDDGLPSASSLTSTWSKVSGPGTVTFGNAGQPSTTAAFSLAGTYVLRLTASDGTLSSQDVLSVNVTAAPVPPPTTPASPTLTGDGTATPTLSGTTQPGAVVHILVDGVEVGTTTAAGDGSWSYPFTGVAVGTHSITVIASNAGGSSPPSSPAVSVTVATAGGSGSGSSSSGGGGGGCGLGGAAATIVLAMLAMCGLRCSE